MNFLKNFIFSIMCCAMAYGSYFFLSQTQSWGVLTQIERLPAAIKQLNVPKNLVQPSPDNTVKKPKEPLWACGCANMTEKEQYQRGCSKGFYFKTMTTASEYAREKCGESCIPDCHAQNLESDDSETL